MSEADFDMVPSNATNRNRMRYDYHRWTSVVESDPSVPRPLQPVLFTAPTNPAVPAQPTSGPAHALGLIVPITNQWPEQWTLLVQSLRISLPNKTAHPGCAESLDVILETLNITKKSHQLYVTLALIMSNRSHPYQVAPKNNGIPTERPENSNRRKQDHWVPWFVAFCLYYCDEDNIFEDPPSPGHATILKLQQCAIPLCIHDKLFTHLGLGSRGKGNTGRQVLPKDQSSWDSVDVKILEDRMDEMVAHWTAGDHLKFLLTSKVLTVTDAKAILQKKGIPEMA